MQKPVIPDLKCPIIMLYGLMVTCFILAFIFGLSDLNSSPKVPAPRVGTPMALAFSMMAMIAAWSAHGLRSVRRYFEQSPSSAASEFPGGDEVVS